jgi:5'-nucleotidase
VRGTAPRARTRPAVRFLLVNDVYTTDTLRDGTGSVARVATLRDSLERSGPVLFVLAGDVLSPSLLSKWYTGRQMVDAFDAAGLDYATFGNHEFEFPRDTLIARLGQSRFRWVSANCTLADGSPFPGVPAWDTLTVAGTRVGIFGLTIVEPYRSYVRCTDPAAAAHQAVADLKRAGAQLVVALTHQNVDDDSLLLARERAVSVVLGGHEHEWHDVHVGDRRVLKADANARTAQVVTLRRQGDAWATGARLDSMDRRVAFDSATQRVVRAWADSLRRRLGPERTVATSAEPLDARDARSRRGETVLGDLVTDGMRLGAGADVAVINSGAMRLDDVLPAGPITNYQLESIFLFGDETRAVTFPLTGARLRELLEHSVADGIYGHGGFLQVSGVRFTYDPARTPGARIVGDLQRPDGRTIAPTDTPRVAMPAYPACLGGDGYKVPEAADACRTVEGAPRTVDLLMALLRDRMAGRIEVPAAGRITRLGPSAMPAPSRP